MCPPVREGLESYLAGKPDANLLRHLDGCIDCREQTQKLREQSLVIRSLRVEEVEPSPGFYARVMERIEAQRGANTIWAVFLQPLFGRNLMFASAVLTVLLGVFLFTSPREEEEFTASIPEQILVEEGPPAVQMVDLEADRNAVFVQLTTFKE
ncbi:MAG: hypothetical protein HY820_09225 [Acidobacteria bacterium]|nr:hypothetical protein [Acidobacteriota bacterium]